ncbi:MAG: HD domain-containing protein [Patescibacteria group bacterium]
MMGFVRYNKAIKAASHTHRHQKYNSDNDTPFIAHPFFVASVLIQYGFDEDAVIAGLLHDAVEDTDMTLDEVRTQFGSRVAGLVEEVTFDQAVAWKERQHEAQVRLRTVSAEAKAIKTADFLHHLILCNEQLDEGSKTVNLHEPQEYLWKYTELIKAIGTGWSHPLLEEAKKHFEIFRQKVGK